MCTVERLYERKIGLVGAVDLDRTRSGGREDLVFCGCEGVDVGRMRVVDCVEGEVLLRLRAVSGEFYMGRMHAYHDE